MEYRLLLLMMENPQKIFSVKNLYESLWEEPFLYSSGNTVMVHIRRLRTKIEEDPQKPEMIQTVWERGIVLGRIYKDSLTGKMVRRLVRGLLAGLFVMGLLYFGGKGCLQQFFF